MIFQSSSVTVLFARLTPENVRLSYMAHSDADNNVHNGLACGCFMVAKGEGGSMGCFQCIECGYEIAAGNV